MQTTFPAEALDALRLSVRGEVLTPADAGFGGVRPPFNVMHDAQAGLVVRCSGTADVVDGVNFAREHGLALAVRGGGHSVAGLSTTDGGMLLDLSPMNGVQVDPERRLAHVQGGALWGDVDRDTQAFGLATPGGVISDTGVAGLTLGGGYGWLRRKHGLSCDNLVEAQVVGADGSIRTASAESNPDLFWAIRGGGGNFGVVTSFTFALHPVGPIVAFAGVMYPLEDAAEIVRGWRAYVADAPDEVSSMMVAITFPAAPTLPPPVHDRACAVVGAVYAGDFEEGLRVLQPLRELGTPVVDLTHPAPYTFVQSAFDPLLPRHQTRSYWKSQYLDELSDPAVDAWAAIAQSRPQPLTIVNLWHLGGAVARVGPEETAFGDRSANYLVSIDGNWFDPSFDEEGKAWVRAAWSDMAAFGTGSVYLNFTGDGEGAAASADSRLAQAKAAYDPGNLFRRNNNVVPAAT